MPSPSSHYDDSTDFKRDKPRLSSFTFNKWATILLEGEGFRRDGVHGTRKFVAETWFIDEA